MAGSHAGSDPLVHEVERLREEVERLQGAARAREELLAVLSHDLRNPLGIVLLKAGLLSRTLAEEGDARTRREVDAILAAASRMERLIRDLLDVAGLQAGRIVLDRRAWQAHVLLELAADAFQPLFAERKISLVLEAEPDTGAALCDRERVEQVFSNLLGNAAKFAPEGGRVAAGARREGGEIVFSVADNGPGLDDEHIPHLFDRWWQARSGDRRGVGLGLSIARALVEAQGGRIWAETRDEPGMVVCFSLPAVT